MVKKHKRQMEPSAMVGAGSALSGVREERKGRTLTFAETLTVWGTDLAVSHSQSWKRSRSVCCDVHEPETRNACCQSPDRY